MMPSKPTSSPDYFRVAQVATLTTSEEPDGPGMLADVLAVRSSTSMGTAAYDFRNHSFYKLSNCHRGMVKVRA
jgi:hypothetical protein